MTDFVDSSTEKIAQDIMANRGDVWLVWSMSDTGVVSLRGIFTEQRFANHYRKYISNFPNLVRVYIEKTITNHLYGEASFETAYGNGPIKFNDFEKIRKVSNK